jgi:hypothetical protein
MGYLLTLPMQPTEEMSFLGSVRQLISHLWDQVDLQVFVFDLNLADDFNQFINSILYKWKIWVWFSVV